jgi:Cytochrome P450
MKFRLVAPSDHAYTGPFVRISPAEIAIADLAAARIIHKVGSGFTKAEWYIKFTDSPRPGIFAMLDPKQHATRRRLFAQPFSKTSMTGYEGVVRGMVDLAVDKIKREAERGVADVLKWWTFMATDVSGELSFGKSFEMLRIEKVSVGVSRRRLN